MEILCIVSLFFVAGLSGLLVKNLKILETASVAAAVISVPVTIVVALKIAATGVYNPFPLIYIDALGAIVMLIVAFLGLATTVYSIPYLQQEQAKQIIKPASVKQYYILLNIFLAVMFLALSVNNPILAWISIEATTLATAFLIGFYNKPSAMEAAWKYLIISSTGLILGFLGTLLYFIHLDPLLTKRLVSWQMLLTNAAQLDPLTVKIAFIFVLIGYGTKIGFVPMHTWKPDAYSKAPAPIGAILSGGLLPVALFILLKFKVITDAAVGPLFTQHLLITFGLLSIIVAALIMFLSKNYKRLLAYSSIENAGIVALGFGFGGLGISAAVLHMIYHACIKVVLFFSAGNFLLKYSSARIQNITGALKVLPVTSVLFFIGFLAVTGIPPSGIFLTKIFILIAGIKAYPAVSIAALFFMMLVFIGFLKHATAMIFGEKPAALESGEGNRWLVIPSLVFITLLFCLSLYIPPFLSALIDTVAESY